MAIGKAWINERASHVFGLLSATLICKSIQLITNKYKTSVVYRDRFRLGLLPIDGVHIGILEI